jgi:hypothetical protein
MALIFSATPSSIVRFHLASRGGTIVEQAAANPTQIGNSPITVVTNWVLGSQEKMIGQISHRAFSGHLGH